MDAGYKSSTARFSSRPGGYNGSIDRKKTRRKCSVEKTNCKKENNERKRKFEIFSYAVANPHGEGICHANKTQCQEDINGFEEIPVKLKVQWRRKQNGANQLAFCCHKTCEITTTDIFKLEKGGEKSGIQKVSMSCLELVGIGKAA